MTDAYQVPVMDGPTVAVGPPQVARDEFPFTGHIGFQGLDIDVENEAGSIRSGHGWSTVMLHHYGEIRGTTGVDGDPLDVYVGPDAHSPLAVVVHQNKPDTGEYDEDKVMLGFRTVDEALDAYRNQYDRPGFYGAHTAMPIGRLLDWCDSRASQGTMVKSMRNGPYIGPRGGKWADPQHTIPWNDGAGAIHVTPHAAIGMHPFNIHVGPVRDGKVKISSHEGGYGNEIPAESLRPMLDDMHGHVNVPESGNKHIEAVRTGKATLLGKGDDGVAYKHGDTVVKVSTTVPYQPFNPGHRTPEQASEMLRKQVETGNKLADLGVPALRSTFVAHGGRGFQIKPHVHIPEHLTRAQLDEIQASIHKMHEHGYALNDDIQVGIHDGKLVMFDTGKAAPAKGEGLYGDKNGDIDRLAGLYRKHGEKFVNTRDPAGLKALDRVESMIDEARTGKKSRPKAFVERHLDSALKQRRDEIKASMSGADMEQALTELDWREEDMRHDIGKHLDVVKSMLPGGPYVGPRGGLWADPKHTIPYDPAAARRRHEAGHHDSAPKLEEIPRDHAGKPVGHDSAPKLDGIPRDHTGKPVGHHDSASKPSTGYTVLSGEHADSVRAALQANDKTKLREALQRASGDGSLATWRPAERGALQADWVGDESADKVSARAARVDRAVSAWARAAVGYKGDRSQQSYQRAYDALDELGRALNLQPTGGADYAQEALRWLRRHGHENASLRAPPRRYTASPEQGSLFKSRTLYDRLSSFGPGYIRRMMRIMAT